MKKTISILSILVVSIQLMVAQNLKKANQLYEKKAFVDAAELYLEIDAKDKETLEKLGDCYYFNTDMRNASLWYKVLMEEHHQNKSVAPEYIFRYTQALKGINNYDEADKWFAIYNDSESIVSNSNLNTLSFFESLNSSIDRPYIIHKLTENTENSEFGISTQNYVAIFASNRKEGNNYDWNNQPYLDLYKADIAEDGQLSNVVPFNATINTKMHESNGIITKDGKTMYFTRNNFIEGKKGKDKSKISHLKIYKAALIDGEWSAVTELPFNSNTYSTTHPALNTDESKLYFSSDMPGSTGSFDLFVVDINSDGTYGNPQNLGTTINTIHREQFPFISSTNNLYFSSDGHFGLGGLDIFKSEISNESFSSPVNLSDKINSNLDDFAFSINEEKETGYFSSNRQGGQGDDDIYRFTQLKRYYLTGIAKNKTTLEFLPGTLVVLTDGSGTKISEVTVGKDAAFRMEIKSNTNYTVKGTLKLFNPTEISFATDSKGNINKNILLHLESYDDAEEDIIVENDKVQIKINPIFFDFDKWNIRPDAALELDKVVAIMKKYPHMIIEIGAHTDVRGSDEYNLVLSHKRAKSVRAYLVANGILNENVQSKGYGETQPLNHCTKPGICPEKEYSINRRCEFVILN